MNDLTTQIFQSIFNGLINMWFIIPLILFVAFFKSRYFKGKLGESIVNFSVTKNLDKNIYHLLKNVTLPTEEGTTQIDHILVSKYGVFVLETKNLKGWIFGSPTQKKWTQKIYKHTNSFQNPLHQNYKHIKELSKLLSLDEGKFHSIIIFIGESTFKTPMPENVLDRGYTKYIQSKKLVFLSDLEVNNIIRFIESKQLEKTVQTNRDHIKHLNEKSVRKTTTNDCPKCGRLLVERIAKQGKNKGNKFYGCSGFPRCRYTKAC